MLQSWKTKDGRIDYDTETKCFTYIGELANEALHRLNNIRRKYNLSYEEADNYLINALDKKLVRVDLTTI